jgi:hypothetical protein
VANHSDVVPVRTNDESCIVARVVVRAQARRTIVFATRLQSRAIESFTLLAILGRQRNRVRGEPATALVCHCKFCQRRTGSAFAVTVYFKEEDVEVLRGALSSCQHHSDYYRSRLPRFRSTFADLRA